MPHFFLMNESEMQEKDALQLRARLHIRSFRTLMRYGKFAHGITTLYDAFQYAARRFSLLHAPDMPEEYLASGIQTYKYLVQKGLVAYDFDLEILEDLVTRALQPDFNETNPDFDFDTLWTEIEQAFHELEILPYDLENLPEENEVTRKVMGIE